MSQGWHTALLLKQSHTAAGMSTFAEIFRRRKNPIRLNKLCAEDEESTSITPIAPGYFFIKALAAAVATDQIMTAPRLLIPLIKF